MHGACALDPAQKHTGELGVHSALGLHRQVTGDCSEEGEVNEIISHQ